MLGTFVSPRRPFWNPAQGISRACLRRFSSAKAIAGVNRRSRMPKPPYSCGLHAVGHATKHCPPCAFSFPA
jgi:hypothetical protein